MAKKVFIRKICDEGDLDTPPEEYAATSAVCWAPETTIGNIAVSSEEVFGSFELDSGNDAILPCNMVRCGKFRNGASRWYCKTHQMHWGTKADIAAVNEFGDISCSNSAVRMSYVVDPFVVDFDGSVEIGIWCSLPPALSSTSIVPRAPRIHVHKRLMSNEKKVIDRDFDAIICSYNKNLGLFDSGEITHIQITPPAAFEFVKALEEGRDMDCVSCKRCGYPHLDLGSFASTPHAKHFCGNCGNDSVWSDGKIVSTPLKPLHDQFNNSDKYIEPERVLNLDLYRNLNYEVWPSTPAIVWTAQRPQEKGIHVHVLDGNKRIVDDTFGTVIFDGVPLSRENLWLLMSGNTIS